MKPLIEAVAQGVEVLDLGREYRVGMPQSPNHPAYWHALPRRHGDAIRRDGGSAANDLITLGTHVGTHIDALAHVSQNGVLHGGVDATDACLGGRFETLGAHTIPPMVGRGLMLDVATVLGSPDGLPGGYEITAEDLDRTAASQGAEPAAADAILVRTGWGNQYDVSEPHRYVGKETGVPGVSEEGAVWLADFAPQAVGADTIAFERVPPGAGHSVLPAHRVLLVDAGVYIIEALNLELIAEREIHEFVLVLAPLNLFGATGAPVRPLAVISA